MFSSKHSHYLRYVTHTVNSVSHHRHICISNIKRHGFMSHINFTDLAPMVLQILISRSRHIVILHRTENSPPPQMNTLPRYITIQQFRKWHYCRYLDRSSISLNVSVLNGVDFEKMCLLIQRLLE